MRGGRLRYPVTIEQQTTTRTSFGSEQQAWSTFASTFAGLEALAGNELLAAQKLVAEAQEKITIRYVAGLTPAMRIKMTDGSVTRYFDILDIGDTRELHREMTLLCKERNLGT